MRSNDSDRELILRRLLNVWNDHPSLSLMHLLGSVVDRGLGAAATTPDVELIDRIERYYAGTSWMER